MSISSNQVVEVLKTIIHPSLGKDIIELGLVKNLIAEDEKIEYELAFSAANDPLKSSIKRACEAALREKFGDSVSLSIKIVTPVNTSVAHKEKEGLKGIKNIIAIASGKGGVGKSTVAANLAIAFGMTGAKVGLIDGDIFGPSIPKMLGAEEEKPQVLNIDGRDLIIPPERFGIKLLSIGFFVDPNDATIWRGPMASNALKQLIFECNWGELDYLFVDLPPGTSDIHLTLVQNVPVTGAVIVSTPQEVALADVIKGINMFRNTTINIPVLGLIENMAWFTPEELPENKYYIFGKDGCVNLAATLNIPLLGQIPIVQSICEGGDKGTPSVLKKDKVSEAFKTVAENLRMEILKRNTYQEPTKIVDITRHRASDFKK
jgi:ATP-binding protein involved in chromosome partitioning